VSSDDDASIANRSTPEYNLGGIGLPDSITRQALLYSLWDGIFASGMFALTETFAVAAAVSLKTPALAVGILGSLPLFIGSVGQIILPSLVDRTRGRKYYVVRAVSLQSFFLLCCALSGRIGAPWGALAFVAAFVLYGCSGNVTNGFWMAWLRGLVPEDVRGRHFAWRNRFFSAVNLLCALTAGVMARKYTAQNAPWTLYALVFVSAAVLRILSASMLARQYEEPVVLERTPLFTRDISRHFLAYALTVALLQGGAAFAGPFFNVWFIRDLHFNYLTLSIAGAATVAGTILFLPVWGRLVDRIGNFRVLHATSFMLSIVPLFYLFFEKPHAVWVLNFYSGISWSGFGISNFNYLLGAAGKKNPDRHIAVAISILGMSVFAFGLLGGFLATRLPVLFSYQLRSLFLISGLLRLTVVLALFGRLRRDEGLEPIRAADFFSNMPGYRAGMGLLRNAYRAFRRI